MAQVKNEEEKKKSVAKKEVNKTETGEKTTTAKKKATTKATKESTAKKQSTAKKTSGVAKKTSKAVKEVKDEEVKKVEEKANTEKKPKTRSTKKTTATTKKTATSTTKSAKGSKNKNSKGKVTKITASKKPEELEENDDVIITDAKVANTEVVNVEDEEKMQMVENELKKDLKSKTKLPKEEEKKLSSVVFENLCVAITFMLYLFFIILGFINIKADVYIVDLKVFSCILLAIAILLFERAYKKDSGKLCAFAIETLFLSIATMGLLYVNIEINNIFLPIAATISLLFAIYYVAKSIYLYTNMKKKYFVDNMKDIMQKEEKE